VRRHRGAGAGFDVNGPNHLEIIEGIGPKIADLLRDEGINTFAVLARTSPTSIQNILDKAGPNFRMANPETWRAVC
jgi:predicted flap endonuclease-1-like 5' DNA nuclease